MIKKSAGVRPETGKFGRDQGMRKILPQAYGGYFEDKILSITQISGKLSIYEWIPALFISFFILFPATTVHSADVLLSWERPDDSRVTGYKIFYGPADTDFKSGPKEIIDTASQTSCDILNLTSGQHMDLRQKVLTIKATKVFFQK